MTHYINRRDSDGIETVDSFDTSKEARAMVAEYSLSDSSAAYYTSTRATREWRNAETEAARPDRIVAEGRGVLAYIDSYAGLIPCRVIAARHDGRDTLLSIVVTGRKSTAYPCGERRDNMPLFRIVPRKAVRGSTIRAFAWVDYWPALRTLRGVPAA